METDVIKKVSNEGETIKVGGKVIKVKQLSFIRHTPLLANLMKGFFGSIQSFDSLTDTALLKGILEIASTDFDGLVSVIEASTGLSKADIYKLEEKDPMAAPMIAKKVFEVNKSFLSQVGIALGFLAPA